MKNSYIFPDPLAKFMSKLSLRVQYESSMMSMSLIFIGMILSAIYLSVYVDFPLWYKVVLVINLLAGMVFIGSFLVTTFQQYQSYLSAIEFQEELKQNEKE